MTKAQISTPFQQLRTAPLKWLCQRGSGKLFESMEKVDECEGKAGEEAEEATVQKLGQMGLSAEKEAHKYTGMKSAGVGATSTSRLEQDFDFMKSQDARAHLQAGGTIFSFRSQVGDNLAPLSRQQIACCVNLSSFENEAEENNVPLIDILDNEQAKLYTIFMTKVSYILPNVHSSQITPELMASFEYQKSCQPGRVTIDENVPDNTTIRFAKVIIPFIFKITLQMKCSSISSSTCKSLGELDGIPVHAGLLLERTKRNSKVVDATRKVKSLMMYTDLADGGVLVRHIVSVFNTTVPSYGAWVMNNLGSFGANEATETAVLTRKFLSQKLYRQVPKNMRGPGEGGTKK